MKATIQRFEADGIDQTTFASGLRNATALAFHPDTGELFTVVQERDGLGDKLVPDYLTRVQQGAFYGWPYAYIGQHPQPGFAQLRPDKVKAAVVPDLLFEAHSSAMDIVFYDGPRSSRPSTAASAFVALKGSWNRSEPTGYKVVRVPFKDGKPVGHYENFVDRLLGLGPAPRRSLGPAGGARRGQGRRAAHCRRHRRHDLAHRLHRSKSPAAARRSRPPARRADADCSIPGMARPMTHFPGSPCADFGSRASWRSAANTTAVARLLIDRFASTASFFQVSYWRDTSAFISSGVVARGSPPIASSLLFTSGTASALRSSALSRSTIGFGRFGGPAMPVQEITSKPGMVASSTVGTSGKSRQRVLPVTASARNSPDFTRALIGPVVAAMKSMSPCQQRR